MRFSFMVIFALVGIITQTFSGNKPIQFKDFFNVSRIGSPVISADGQHIVFTVKKANIEKNSYRTQIWKINPDGTGLQQLTKHSASSTHPEFSPNGKHIYFLSKRNDSNQVWKIPVSGGKAKEITNVYGDIDGFAVSPNSDQLLLIRSVDPNCKDEECIEKAEETRKKSEVKARVIDNLMFRHWNSWLEGKYSHLFLSNIKDKRTRDLTPGPYHTPPISLGGNQDYTFSPDGNEICYVTNMDKELAISTNNDIFIIPAGKEKVKKISVSAGNDNSPTYSPDGKYIAYLSMERAGFEADRQRLMLYDRQAGKTKELTVDFTLSVGEILWTKSSREIYFTAGENGNISIYKVSVQSGKRSDVLKGHYIHGMKFLDSKTLVFAKQSSRMPYEIFSYDLELKQINQITRFNDSDLEKFDLPGYEEFWFPGANGEKIHGFIMRPPGFEMGKKYPAIHLIHGGPQGMWSNNWHFRWNYQMFASPGYVVYYINFHGSRGYGQEFTNSISRHWGDLPYEDLVKGTEYVLQNYDFVDPERLAAAGASYGGFMVNWIAGHENPYKCLISHDGVYDLRSKWGSTEELWFPEWEMGGVPWDKDTDYEKWSPSNLAANFKTPTLIIHGEHDYRIPYTQAFQFFSALQRQGVPSRLLFFPDEDHFVRKPQNAQFWWKNVHEWLDRYLGQ